MKPFTIKVKAVNTKVKHTLSVKSADTLESRIGSILQHFDLFTESNIYTNPTFLNEIDNVWQGKKEEYTYKDKNVAITVRSHENEQEMLDIEYDGFVKIGQNI